MAVYHYLLIPGRHHVLTMFQHDYLRKALTQPPLGLDGQPVHLADDAALVWAVTSADQAGTRRNPLPGHRREAAIERFGADLPAPSLVYLIDDIATTERFADHVIKDIEVQSRGQHRLTPRNTVVACSTPAVIELYERLGYRILPLELTDRTTGAGSHARPWDLVTALVAAGRRWRRQPDYLRQVHPASRQLLEKYHLGEVIVETHSDPLMSDEGDITETRDYATYRLAFDEGAERKYSLVQDHIVPGRIVDVGCATGSILKLMSHDGRLRESDLYGIEVARPLHRLCLQRQENGEFGNENTFFYQRNIMRSPLFAPGSVQTTTTFSLTHEIESYIGHAGLLTFIRQIYRQTAPGGVFINLDVVGPERGDDMVLLELATDDGAADDGRAFAPDQQAVYTPYLNGLSTEGRFYRFLRDFRRVEGDGVTATAVERAGRRYWQLRLADAAEFLATKDYTASWFSEMHERFCYWSFSDWSQAVTEAGFTVDPASHAFQNPWIVEHRWRGKARLWREVGQKLESVDYPVTNLLLVARRESMH